MTLTRFTLAIFIAAGTFTLPASLSAVAKTPADMKMIDPDSDGTVSLAEAQDAAAKKFAALDKDQDATVDMKESKGMTKGAFKKADGDKDGTIDKSEYMASVEAAFKMADRDGDGTLDAKELATPAGKNLLKLIK